MRIFVALNIDHEIRERIARFQEEVRGFAPEARWVPSESLHLTLKFVGEEPAELVEKIKCTLATVSMDPFEVTLCGYGFFPSNRAARVFWIGIESGPQLAALAGSIEKKLRVLGVPPGDHVFSPHLTLARRAGASGPRVATRATDLIKAFSLCRKSWRRRRRHSLVP